ncbi:hypothetical protein LRS13_07700 [Svornostia abyssi]|uniref:XRE family transcriptional regulator n=1 Tax=Svornostia abyssi TaxID=2898438 RepID=A0ABY5PL90_9ACTN|nr:hypothetical protein LRS13_07700 [Parviterribacteraceae bacterium J379]
MPTLDHLDEETRRTQLSFYATTLDRLYEVADQAFALPTGEVAKSVDLSSVCVSGRTASATADPEVIAATSDAPVLRALEQLRGWLNLSYEDLARVAGIKSASLIYYWRKKHREHQPVRPRPASVEQLWRVHSIMRAVSEALDGSDSAYGLQVWIRAERDGVTPLDLLMAGDLEGVESRARSLLFDQTPAPTAAWGLVALEAEAGEELPRSDRVDNYSDVDFG